MARLIHPQSGEPNHGLARPSPDKVLRFYIHVAVYLLINVVLAILNFQKNPEHIWFFWVTMGWGIGVVAHAFRVIGVIGPHSRLARHR